MSAFDHFTAGNELLTVAPEVRFIQSLYSLLISVIRECGRNHRPNAKLFSNHAEARLVVSFLTATLATCGQSDTSLVCQAPSLGTCKLCFFSSLLCYAPMPKPLPYYAPENAYYAPNHAHLL